MAVSTSFAASEKAMRTNLSPGANSSLRLIAEVREEVEKFLTLYYIDNKSLMCPELFGMKGGM
jgi:hypothetical protein